MRYFLDLFNLLRSPLRYFSSIQRDVDSFFVVGETIDTIGLQRKVLKFEANV